MAVYHLRSYFLKTVEAKNRYLAIWNDHIDSLSKVGIHTNGFFSVLENDREVIALIGFADDDDPTQAIEIYMNSPGFKKDMTGFDMIQIERVEVLNLIPGPGSPLL